jgi:hypothetical protein
MNSIAAKRRSADILVVRVYVGMPLLGETKTLLWAPQLGSQGRC